MPHRALGQTGLLVPVIGLGASHLGDAPLEDADAARLLDAALELGVNLVDTARSYAFSEERIGRHLCSRRQEVILSTKVGYAIPGHENWTAGCVTAGIERALDVLRTDVIDLVYLHSCSLDVLVRGECTDALHRAVRAGKVRVAGYAGDGRALEYAMQSGAFGAFQLTCNIYDQSARARLRPAAAERGAGVLVKRPLGGAPWRYAARPPEEDLAEYWDRHRAMQLNRMGLAWEELALRFAVHQPGVAAVLVGTRSAAHLRAAVAALEYGPLPAPMLSLVQAAFERHGAGWPAVT
ncbi:MAG: aldo/keto reductase [Deltaproteobacteria bacterium]|nr:aldo/keto reductase [Deltaproteobacteria bacterium]